jgi:hypothetical protein
VTELLRGGKRNGRSPYWLRPSLYAMAWDHHPTPRKDALLVRQFQSVVQVGFYLNVCRLRASERLHVPAHNVQAIANNRDSMPVPRDRQ